MNESALNTCGHIWTNAWRIGRYLFSVHIWRSVDRSVSEQEIGGRDGNYGSLGPLSM